MTIVKTVPEDRPVAVGDVLVVKPFGGHVMTRGLVHLVTEHVVYYRCTPRHCRDCAPNRYDSNQRESHRVWRSWLDWYREDNDDDREIRQALASRDMRMWNPCIRRYVIAPEDGVLRPATG